MTKAKREGATPAAPASQHGHHPTGGNVVPLREATRTWFADLAADLRRPGRADRGDAAQAGRREALDRPAAIPARAELLHAAARARRPSSWPSTPAGCSTARRGGLIAGVLFVLPGLLALLALSAIYVGFGDTELVTALFAGLAPAVIAIVVQAVYRVGKRSLAHPVAGRPGGGLVPGAGPVRGAVPGRRVRAPALLGWLLGQAGSRRWASARAQRDRTTDRAR